MPSGSAVARNRTTTHRARRGRLTRWLSAVAVVAAGVAVPTVVSAPAEALSIGNVTGAVSDVRGVDGTTVQCIRYAPGAGTPSPDEVDVSYGIPSGAGGCPASLDLTRQSGVGFDAHAPGDVAAGEAFLLASIIHYNNPIQGLSYSGRSAYIGGTLSLRLGDFQGTPTVDYPWRLEETQNTAGQCPYGATGGVPCDDRLSFTDPSGSRTVTDAAGQRYRLTITSVAKAPGASCPATPPASATDAFVTPERQATTGCVYGILDPVRQVTIEKQTVPQDAPDRFTFDLDGTTVDGPLPATTTLGDDDTATYEINGDATFGERETDSWTLADLACTGDTSDVRTDLAAGTVAVGAEGGDVHCTFTNSQGGAVVEKRDADGGALIGAATFRFEHAGRPAIVVTDNETPDADPTLGRVEVRGLVPGAWTVTETAAPDGYRIDDPRPVAFTVPAGDATPVRVPAFTDTRLTAELAVIKHEARPDGTSTGTIVAGATFQLWRESNGRAGLQPGDDTAVGTPCTTTGTAPCSVEDLAWGTYYWQETQAPQGYQLPADAVSGPIVVDATNAGSDFPVTVIGDPQKRSGLAVVKRDAVTGENLAGATFALHRESGATSGLQPGEDTLAGSCVTDAAGGCTIGDLPFGEYYWRETAAPTGYTLPGDPVVGPVRVDATNAGTVIAPSEVSDPQILSELTVLKRDASTGALLDGAVFDLRRIAPDGTATTYGSCTTVAGRCTVGGLEFGTYSWRERTPPVGYDLPADRDSDPIDVGPANAGGELTVTTFRDPQTSTELAVLKQDQESGTTLDGATFALHAESNGTPGLQPGEDRLVAECTTSGGVACVLDGLPHGTYYWLETVAPQGYDLPAGAQSGPIVVVAENAGTTFPVTVIGDPQKQSTLSVAKHDADTGAVLAGATFVLVRDADGDGRYDAAVDTRLQSCTTTAEPCGTGPVGFGTYFWVETAAPEGYRLPEAAVSAPIVVTAANAGTTFTPVPVADPQERSRIVLRKSDAFTGDVLAGAVFQLYVDTDGDGVRDPGEPVAGSPRTTDAKGRITWDDLLIGGYVAVETKAPKGYLLPKDAAAEHPVEVTTASAGTTLTIAVTNERDGSIGGIVEDQPDGGPSDVLPNTGAPAHAVGLVGLAALLLLLGGWLLRARRATA